MTDADIHRPVETYGTGKQGHTERTRSNRRRHQVVSGGKVIGVYLVMGEYDYITIGECPSDEVQTAFALALSSQGNVKTTTLKAFPVKEIPAILNMLPKP
jgi:uncharacterized protein with GYD domain